MKFLLLWYFQSIVVIIYIFIILDQYLVLSCIATLYCHKTTLEINKLPSDKDYNSCNRKLGQFQIFPWRFIYLLKMEIHKSITHLGIGLLEKSATWRLLRALMVSGMSGISEKREELKGQFTWKINMYLVLQFFFVLTLSCTPVNIVYVWPKFRIWNKKGSSKKFLKSLRVGRR